MNLDKILSKISDIAENALLQELHTTPKYGLVCPISCGSHSDMNYETFIYAIAALKQYFGQFAECAFFNADKTDLLLVSRPLGIEAEKAMLKATKGINTHKGALFCLGLCSLAIGYLLAKQKEVTLFNISQTIKAMCAGLCEKEFGLASQKKFPTHGEQMFIKYGVLGARGLAEKGYEEVIKTYVPLLDELYKIHDKNQAHSRLLAKIASETEDINILYRSDYDTLKLAQDKCAQLYENYSVKEALKLNEWFIEKNISCGGSADILSLTLFLYEIDKKNCKI